MLPSLLRVAVVMTNHAAYPSRPDTTGLWLTELTHFYEVFNEAGIDMVFVSPQGGAVPLDGRSLGRLYTNASARALLQDPAFMDRLAQTCRADEVDPEAFDAIFYTGGHGTMWDFRGQAGLNRLAEGVYRQGGVVGSVCHGAAGLLDLLGDDGRPLVAGRQLTGFSNVEEALSGVQSQVPYHLQTELQSRGALYQKGLLPFMSHVVTDGRLVTGQNPGSSAEVARAVLRAVQHLPARAHRPKGPQ